MSKPGFEQDSASNKIVLVVEDNPKIGRMFSLLLDSAGIDSILFDSGEGALSWLARHKPSIIVMDIQLPHMDGLTLISKIKSRKGYEKIPIIAVTAYAMKGDRERILAAGCDEYVAKPISTKSFLSVLHKYL